MPPNSSWRTLSERYALYKVEYQHTLPGGPYVGPFWYRAGLPSLWKELFGPAELDDPVTTVLPPHQQDLTDLRLKGEVHPLPAGFGEANALTHIVWGDAYGAARGIWTELINSLGNFDQLACSPACLWVPLPWTPLRLCGRAIGRASSHLVVITGSSFDLVRLKHHSLKD